MRRLALLFTCAFGLIVLVRAQNQGVAQQKTTEPDSGSSCLTRFKNDLAHFEPCKNKTCFLFLSQPPFIILDPTMRSESHQRLFPCKNRTKYFSKLEGVAFKIHQALTSDNSLCVWAGAECSKCLNFSLIIVVV